MTFTEWDNALADLSIELNEAALNVVSSNPNYQNFEVRMGDEV